MKKNPKIESAVKEAAKSESQHYVKAPPQITGREPAPSISVNCQPSFSIQADSTYLEFALVMIGGAFAGIALMGMMR